MELNDFKRKLSKSNPNDIAEEYLYSSSIFALDDPEKYKQYTSLIAEDYKKAEHIAVMGSGNWRYSLNPYKEFRPFGENSDIDIVLVCADTFHKTWEELRDYHRNNFYLLALDQKTKFRRNGENVYSGFVSPKWIPNIRSRSRVNYDVNMDKYSNETIGYKKVNMFYFKNNSEAIDYCARGFRSAKGRI